MGVILDRIRCPRYVRFTPNRDRVADVVGRQLRANKGREAPPA
jgi:hypothetical protein